MSEVIATSTLLMLVYAVMAVSAAWGLLRLLDRASGVNFKQTIRAISDDPKASAHYLGLRFIGVCLLFGLVIS